MYDNDVAKYKKKTKSDTSFAKAKSKHKHIYANGLVIIDNKYKSVYIAKYCTICGKLDNLRKETIKTDKGYMMLTDKELLEKYKDLPHFTITDMMEKFVSITDK